MLDFFYHQKDAMWLPPYFWSMQIFSLCGRNVVNISAGKYWSSAVTETGDVYMWDGKKVKEKPPVTTRLHGVKRASSVSVGETHLLIIGTLYHPVYPSNMVKNPQKQKSDVSDELEEISEYLMPNDTESCNQLTVTDEDTDKSRVPSLKSLCEKVAADNLVEPRNAIQLLEIADSLEAHDLRKHCEVFFLGSYSFCHLNTIFSFFFSFFPFSYIKFIRQH